MAPLIMHVCNLQFIRKYFAWWFNCGCPPQLYLLAQSFSKESTVSADKSKWSCVTVDRLAAKPCSNSASKVKHGSVHLSVCDLLTVRDGRLWIWLLEELWLVISLSLHVFLFFHSWKLPDTFCLRVSKFDNISFLSTSCKIHCVSHPSLFLLWVLFNSIIRFRRNTVCRCWKKLWERRGKEDEWHTRLLKRQIEKKGRFYLMPKATWSNCSVKSPIKTIKMRQWHRKRNQNCTKWRRLLNIKLSRSKNREYKIKPEDERNEKTRAGKKEKKSKWRQKDSFKRGDNKRNTYICDKALFIFRKFEPLQICGEFRGRKICFGSLDQQICKALNSTLYRTDVDMKRLWMIMIRRTTRSR